MTNTPSSPLWKQLKIIIALVALLALLALSFWYGAGGRTPLSQTEVDNLINTISAQTQKPGGRHNFQKLRTFLEADNGEPFYTVNLYKFYPEARYDFADKLDVEKIIPEGEPYGSGSDAYDRFAKSMIPLLAKHGAHPVFGTRWMAKNDSDWDRLIIVRYRSRRDIAEMFTTDAYVEANIHKWAALENNERFKVQGRVLPELYMLLGFLAGFILIYLVGRRTPLSNDSKIRNVVTRPPNEYT